MIELGTYEMILDLRSNKIFPASHTITPITALNKYSAPSSSALGNTLFTVCHLLAEIYTFSIPDILESIDIGGYSRAPEETGLL